MNYKGGDKEVGACYKDDPANCEITGRFYKWADFMNAADSGDALTNHGICPEGWEVPDTTLFQNLFKNHSADLYSPSAWTFVDDAHSFDPEMNTSGFTALGGRLYINIFWNSSTQFCIASAARGNRYYAIMEPFQSSSTKVSTSSYDYCNLRCVKSAVVAEEDE